MSRADFVKIPHHDAERADCSDMWEASSPVALGLSQNGITVRTLSARIGVARCRRTPGSPWTVQLFGQAKQIGVPARKVKERTGK